MLRKLLIAAALAGAAVLPAGGASAASPSPVGSIVSQSLLMPNVGYQRLVQFTPRGPVVLDVVTAPRPDGSLYTLAPALSNGAIVGTEKLTDMQKDVSGTSTTVGDQRRLLRRQPGRADRDPDPRRLARLRSRDGPLQPRHRRRRLAHRRQGRLRRHVARDEPAPPARPQREAGQRAHDALHLRVGADDSRRVHRRRRGRDPVAAADPREHRRPRARHAGRSRRRDADPAGRRGARLARGAGAASDRRGAGGDDGRAAADADAELGRDVVRDRRRPGARHRRQGRLPDERGVRRPDPQHPRRAQRRRPALGRTDPARHRRGRQRRVQRRDDELRARGRHATPRRGQRDGARQRLRRVDGVRRDAAQPPVQPPAPSSRSRTRCCSRTPASTRRRRPRTCSRRTATASPTPRRSRTSSSASRR